MSKRFFALCLSSIFFFGCVGINDTMTPSLSVQKDQFDGSLIINQPSVSASSSLTESWHTLGFQWNQKYPKVVFLEVGVQGVKNVTGVAFNVDGEVIENIKEASSLTAYGDWSTRRLVMPVSDFVKVAMGRDVKMKVTQIDTYTVSSFGLDRSGAIVNSKFPPFIQKLRENKVL
ncbi:hypothetical protein [Rheinheimera nanhaiensis]|nr:hypothetical protein [Rheinheimera nanhaiensis]